MPVLTVIAGCNGAGKSSYAKAISTNKLSSFDYDKVYLRVYNSLRDSELKERMSHNLAYKELEESVYQAIKNKTDFTYETNFNSEPLYWPEKFKKAGYQIRLIYFCLRSIKEAKRRVQIRVENGGHFVPESEINLRYKLGFENSKWDTLMMFTFLIPVLIMKNLSFCFQLLTIKLINLLSFQNI